MRIALLTSFFAPDSETGIARYVEDLALGLIARGMDLTVIAAGDTSNAIEQRGPLKIYWVPSRSREKLSILPSIQFLHVSYKMHKVLKTLHARKPFDIIEYPNTESPAIVSLLLGLAKPKPKYVIRMASPMFVNLRKGVLPRLNGLLECWQAQLSNAYISHSGANLKICEDIYQLSRRKPKKVILLGLPEKKQPLLLSATAKKDLTIFFIGHMESRKGFDILASAWPKIATLIPEAHLVVAGVDRPYKNGNSFFNWAIRDMPVHARERLTYHGMVSSQIKDTLYQNAYICVMPSRYESFGLVILEAMQYSLPIVSTNIGGIPEVIKDGHTGILIPPDDHTALSDSVIKLCQDRNLYNRISRSVVKEFTNQFSIDRVAEETEQFYRSLIIENT